MSFLLVIGSTRLVRASPSSAAKNLSPACFMQAKKVDTGSPKVDSMALTVFSY